MFTAVVYLFAFIGFLFVCAFVYLSLCRFYVRRLEFKSRERFAAVGYRFQLIFVLGIKYKVPPIRERFLQ